MYHAIQLNNDITAALEGITPARTPLYARVRTYQTDCGWVSQHSFYVTLFYLDGSFDVVSAVNLTYPEAVELAKCFLVKTCAWGSYQFSRFSFPIIWITAKGVKAVYTPQAPRPGHALDTRSMCISTPLTPSDFDNYSLATYSTPDGDKGTIRVELKDPLYARKIAVVTAGMVVTAQVYDTAYVYTHLSGLDAL